MLNMVKSISFDEEEILLNILKLHCKGDIDMDPTYSKGNFYKNRKIKEPKFKFDINPQVDGVEFANSEDIPIDGSSLDTVIFDPPFLATKGQSLLNNHGNIITKRFGLYPTEKELHQFYLKSLTEIHRVLKDDGILIFKCQDKVSGGTQYFSHVFIMNQAENVGFYVKDLFILLAKNRITPQWQVKNQKNARKYHSYFIVLQKSKKRPTYLQMP